MKSTHKSFSTPRGTEFHIPKERLMQSQGVSSPTRLRPSTSSPKSPVVSPVNNRSKSPSGTRRIATSTQSSPAKTMGGTNSGKLMSSTKTMTFNGVKSRLISPNLSPDVTEAIRQLKAEVNAQKGPLMRPPVVEVWGGGAEIPDTTRVDKILDSMRTKIETLVAFRNDPEHAVRKLFKDNSDNGGSMTEQTFVKFLNFKFGMADYEAEVKALFRRFDSDRSGTLDVEEFVQILLNPKASSNNGNYLIGRIREALAKRGGGSGLKCLAIQFKTMDTSKDGYVDRKEIEIGFQKFLRAYGISLSPRELDNIFVLFDANGDGSITYDEFVHGIRGVMNEKRTELVKSAFNVIDEDRNGVLTLQEVAARYDVSKHPQVRAGKITAVDAIKAFMHQWKLHSKSHSDDITLKEFIDYYDWISMNIDRDDYFELMIRNAWHIPGGEGWAQNTTNLRVLVTHLDGTQTIETLKDDLGLKRGDAEMIKKRLAKQGVFAQDLAVYDASEL